MTKSKKPGWLRRMERRLTHSRILRGAAVRSYGAYMGFVFRTTRWERIGYEPFIASLEAGRPFVIVNWHGRLAMMPYAWDWRTWDLTILSFRHPTAEVMTEGLAPLDIEVLKLSRNGPNTSVLRQAVAAFRSGRCLGITPDGPNGPGMVPKAGALELAALCRARIAPITFAVRRRIVIRSWDRFILPLPYNRGVFMMGAPYEVPRPLTDEAREDELARLKQVLDDLSARADAMFGQTPPMPK